MSPLSLSGFIIITTSIVFALLLSIIPFPQWLTLLLPQWLVLVVIYWVLELPHRVNLGIAWILGLILDGLYGSLLGEHALALTVVAYLVDRFHRQIRMFPMLQQAAWVFVLVFIYQTILIWIQGILGLLPNIYLFWLSALTSMLFWPWLFVILRSCRGRYAVY